MSKRLLVLNADGSTDGTAGVFSGGFPDSVILLANGWEQQTDGSYAQTATVSGVSDRNGVIADINTRGATPITYDTFLAAWFCVGDVFTVENGLLFVCYKSPPEIDINVKVTVF